MPRTKQKKELSRRKSKKKKKKDRWLPFSVHKPQLGVFDEKKSIDISRMSLSAWKESLECFRGNGVRSVLSRDRRGSCWWMWTLHPSKPKAQAHPKVFCPVTHPQQPTSMDLPMQPCIKHHRRTRSTSGTLLKILYSYTMGESVCMWESPHVTSNMFYE